VLFFHWTGISADINVTDGDKVEFNVFDGDKEPTATNILPID
jgi:cold shock CspA family protein|tara:strand:+ start:677 stop:802 length:126 start_codon:yes stop_codon:yes gene_type:complete